MSVLPLFMLCAVLFTTVLVSVAIALIGTVVCVITSTGSGLTGGDVIAVYTAVGVTLCVCVCVANCVGVHG